MRIGHVRFYEPAIDRRLGAEFSAAKTRGAKTICGDDPTAWDFTRNEARRLMHSEAAGVPDGTYIVCARCAAIMKGGG